jgi:hypothetical protein
MELGTYTDGRPLNYDEAARQFTIGTVPVTPEQVIGYDRVGQVTWSSDEVRNQALGYAAAVAANAPVAPPKQGWFSQLPVWGKVLFILMYPVAIVYGVVVMWKDKRYSQVARIAITAVAAIFFISVAITASNDDTTTTASKPASVAAPTESAPAPASTAVATPETAAPDAAVTPAPKPAPVTESKPPSIESYLRTAVTDELGDKTNMGDKPKIRDVQESGGKGYYLVSLNGNENLTNNMTKEGMWIDSKDVWERVFTERKDVKELVIYWYFPLVDAKGNSSDDKVMSLVMTKKNASDVNWDNVLIENIPVIADEYHESPVFNN